MAFREVTMLEIKEVLRLWLEGRPEEAHRRRARPDVKTVRRYVNAAERSAERAWRTARGPWTRLAYSR